jgi:hypothetical protein
MGIQISDLEDRIAKLEECAAVLREVVKWRNATSGEYTRWQNAWDRAEQALAALDKGSQPEQPQETPGADE